MNPFKIVRLGDPALRVSSVPVETSEFGSDALKEFVASLFKFMENETGIGIAAPQIGIRKRIVVFGMDKHPRYADLPSIPYTALVNPSFEPLSDEKEEGYEGCLSLGTLRGKVARYKKIIYRGYNLDGHFIEREASGLHARVVQHEYDHLDGIVFLDRMKDYSSLGFYEELLAAGLLNVNTPSE